MSKTLLTVNGLDGQIELHTDRIVITRKGFLNMFKYGIGQRREIPISSISSVYFNDANFFKPGTIDFDFAGRSQLNSEQNRVKFMKKSQEDFFNLKEKIFFIMSQIKK